jgi:hypothetical protein
VKAGGMIGVLMSAGSIGSVNVLESLLYSTFGSGYGIGDDHVWGTADDKYPYGSGSIKGVTVGGDMVETSIAAGVHPGPNGMYGGTDLVYMGKGGWGEPTDDYITRRLSLKGQIGSVKVGGTIYGATDSSGNPTYAPGAGSIEAAGKIGKVFDSTASVSNPTHTILGGIVIRSFL